MVTKIKKVGRPKIDSEAVRSRFPRDLLNALDQYIREEQPGMDRPEALRHAFRDWAISMGYVKPPR
jgi:hypothetical protein